MSGDVSVDIFRERNARFVNFQKASLLVVSGEEDPMRVDPTIWSCMAQNMQVSRPPSALA